MGDKASRELTPADLRVLEPDVLGALAIVLHGCDEPAKTASPRPPANWRGRRSRRAQDGRAG